MKDLNCEKGDSMNDLEIVKSAVRNEDYIY